MGKILSGDRGARGNGKEGFLILWGGSYSWKGFFFIVGHY